MRITLLVATLSSVVLAAAGEEGRDGRFFQGGFHRDGDSMHWRGGLDLSNLRDTMLQVSSSLDTALDHLTDRIEER
ncbi:hypothetical protein Pmani_035738, partial [Petrolisthes manimaculis]